MTRKGWGRLGALVKPVMNWNERLRWLQQGAVLSTGAENKRLVRVTNLVGKSYGSSAHGQDHGLELWKLFLGLVAVRAVGLIGSGPRIVFARS